MILQLTPTQALLTCLLLAFTYVSSLYLLWRGSILHNRNDPDVIMRRIASVLLVCLLAPLTLYYYAVEVPAITTIPQSINLPFHRYLNLTTVNLVYSVLVSTLLLCILYGGSLYSTYLDTQLQAYDQNIAYTELLRQKFNVAYFTFTPINKDFWLDVRNLLVAPTAEEWVFRLHVCTLLLSSGFSLKQAILINPLIFALAHVHHIVAHMQHHGMTLQQATMTVGVQLSYTTLFGIIASILYLHTGHIADAIVVHSLCNYLGLPNVNILLNKKHRLYNTHRTTVIGYYVIGIIVFIGLMWRLTYLSAGTQTNLYVQLAKYNAALAPKT